MSIQTEINRLNTAKTNILKSIKNKGVDTSNAGTLSDVPTLIDNISTSEDLTNEFNAYETYLSTQETTIEDIITTLQGKGTSGGSDEELVSVLDRSVATITNANLTKVGDYAFYNCTSLTSASFPNVTTITTASFRGCTKLSTISIPKVTSIGTNAFMNCSSLVNMNISKVNTVNTSLFYACSSLESVNFPDATSVKNDAFRDCKKLKTVELAKVTTINPQAFLNCSVLEKLILRSTTMCTLSNVSAFNGSSVASGTGFVYVPDTLVSSYKTATNWSTYANQIKGLSEL